jgi:hypothetical protein
MLLILKLDMILKLAQVQCNLEEPILNITSDSNTLLDAK